MKLFSKHIILSILALLIIFPELYADNSPEPIEAIGYTYDGAGNRTGRKIIILTLPGDGEEGPTHGIDGTEDSTFNAPPFVSPGGIASNMGGNPTNTEGSGGSQTGGGSEPYGSSQNDNRNPAASEQENEHSDEGSTQTSGSTENENTAAMFDFMETRQIVIYPNPTRGQLKVEIRGESDTEQIPVNVFDVGGRLVFSQKMNENPLLIDLSGRADGTYILRIDEGDKASVWKIIKQ
jgi:hypothetical protein